MKSALPCSSCLAGKFQEEANAVGCDDCQEGKYSETVGATTSSNCLDCQVGRYSEQLGADSPSDCLLCGQGKFLPTEGEQTSGLACKTSKANDSSDGWKRGAKRSATRGSKDGSEERIEDLCTLTLRARLVAQRRILFFVAPLLVCLAFYWRS